MGTVVINNKTYNGNQIIINNGKIMVDGKDETPTDKEINIVITGDIQSLSADACESITVNGNVTGELKTMSGDVVLSGSVSGDVKTMSGDVECQGSIGGNVKTMSGDIRSYNLKKDK